jgi:hypothetical protein
VALLREHADSLTVVSETLEDYLSDSCEDLRE